MCNLSSRRHARRYARRQAREEIEALTEQDEEHQEYMSNNEENLHSDFNSMELQEKNFELQNLRDRNKLKKPSRYTDCYLACTAMTVEEPQTYKEAISGDYAEHWKQAMEEEINSLRSNNTWSLVKIPKNARILDCKWVYRLKYKSDGSIERYKVRLCAKGYMQREGIDCHETFSPVVKYDSVRTLIALATEFDMHIQQFDVKTAFLHGELREEIFIKQPKGFETDPSLVYKLHKSLYGLKQSPKYWN